MSASEVWIALKEEGTMFSYVGFAASLAVAVGLFTVRVHRIRVYASIEILVGMVALTQVFFFPSRFLQIEEGSDLAQYLAVVGGIYIIVRGLDNFRAGT